MVRKLIAIPAAAIALGALLTGTLDHQRAQAAEKAYPPIGDFVTLDGRKVHYVQAGDGPDIVLLHGAGGNLRDFTFDLFDRLTDRYRVTAFDRPGAGYTDRAPGVETGAFATDGESPAEQAQMLRAAATELGLVDPIVVGHSFGGIVAMAWANAGLETEAEVNAAAVVSLAGVLMPWPGDLGAYYTVNGSVLGSVTVPVISAFVPQSTVSDAIVNTFRPQDAPEGYADYIGAPLTMRVENFRANARQVNGLRPHVVEMTQRYGDLSLPIEIVHGTADESVPIEIHPREFIKIVPSANLTELQGVGHMPHHVDPQAAVDAIDRAVQRAGLR